MNNKCAFFITSTGTELGKTFLSEKIIFEFYKRGESIDSYKPILSGFDSKDLMNNDSAKLLAASKKKVTIENIKHITPWLYKDPIAPTIAAKNENKKITYQRVKNWCLDRKDTSTSNFILYEGAGGIMVPIEKQKTFIDLFKDTNFPVILVVGSYLGTISHTLSAMDNLSKRNIKIISIVINEGMKSNKKSLNENLALLKSSITKNISIRTLSANLKSKNQQIKLIVNDILRYFKKMA